MTHTAQTTKTPNVLTMNSRIVGTGKGQKLVPFPTGHNVLSIAKATPNPRDRSVIIEYVERKTNQKAAA